MFRVFALFIVLTSCGYRWQPDYPHSSRPTIAVPFVKGDDDGSFTTEIIRALATSGIADVRLKSVDYRLEVTVISSTLETIGYRKDKQKVDREINRNMVATEARKAITIEATLYKGVSEEIAYGPYSIQGDADYDYVDGDSYQDLTFVDSKGFTQAVLPFSLGQLESPESAQEAAIRPLYAHLAKKIVDVISAEW